MEIYGSCPFVTPHQEEAMQLIEDSSNFQTGMTSALSRTINKYAWKHGILMSVFLTAGWILTAFLMETKPGRQRQRMPGASRAERLNHMKRRRVNRR